MKGLILDIVRATADARSWRLSTGERKARGGGRLRGGENIASASVQARQGLQRFDCKAAPGGRRCRSREKRCVSLRPDS